MDFEVAFSVAGMIVMPAWLLLILGPRRYPLERALTGAIVPAVLSLGYAALIITHIGEGEGGFDTLAGVRSLFTVDGLLLAGWIHYLAFDLLIGHASAGRMDTRGVSRLVQAPLLFLVFMLGPLGWLLCEGVTRLHRTVEPAKVAS